MEGGSYRRRGDRGRVRELGVIVGMRGDGGRELEGKVTEVGS